MAKRTFKSVRFSEKSLGLIENCNTIIADYQSQGLRLTLRQLYYQLVTKNIIPNVERSYKNLSALLTDARMSGKTDWNAIEDRIRQPVIPAEWSSIGAIAESAARSFRLPRRADQPKYVELWVEKDALAGVLEPLADEAHVTLMVNRGYSSASAMYESAQRFAENGEDEEGEPRELIMLYLGDFDPSGEDMVRDVRDRLETFRVSVDVQKIALTRDQIDQYDPPPNPAKMSDPRAAAFVAEHGSSSYEVDALPPNVLARLVRAALAEITDQEKMAAVIEREEAGKAALRKAAKTIDQEIS
jgi:hypothetical protein